MTKLFSFTPNRASCIACDQSLTLALHHVLTSGSKEQYQEFMEEAEKACRESGYYADTVQGSISDVYHNRYVRQCCRYEDLSIALKKVYGEEIYDELNTFYQHIHLFNHLKEHRERSSG